MDALKRKQDFVREALHYMDELFSGYPLTELHYQTPFQLVVAVILSAQTTDKQVNKATEQLFRIVSRPEDIVSLGEKGVGEMIKTVGLWTSKTKNLVKMAHILASSEKGQSKSEKNTRDVRVQQWQYADAHELCDERGYHIPDTIPEMLKLPGVGIKTAKVVLYILYGQRWVAVDTHVHRVMNRLGIVATHTPEQTSAQLENIIPDELKDIAHRVIIYFGRYRCTAKNPKCAPCALKTQCNRYKKTSGSTKEIGL